MKEYIANLIQQQSSQLITYETYMNELLYHPILGYYMKKKEKIGKHGDFYTSSNISDVFGKLFARWFLRKTQSDQLPALFCEIGGGNGRFAEAFIKEWMTLTNEALEYRIVEGSPYHRHLQKERLKELPGWEQYDAIEGVPKISGVVFSNELFDALPVRVVEKRQEKIFEVMVGVENDQLCEKLVHATDQKILSYLKEEAVELKENQRFEIPLAMDRMIESISAVLERGYVVSVDYGYTNEEWMQLPLQKGSLRGYYQHEMIKDPLKYPGEMDLTTHIHIDRLVSKGVQVGMSLQSVQRQDEFLLAEGILKDLEDHYDPNPFSDTSKRNRAIRSLILPSGISDFFQVIIQKK